MSQFCEQKQLLVQDIRILKGLLLQKCKSEMRK